jgi:soluble lytic murein transglycosylase-like protein
VPGKTAAIWAACLGAGFLAAGAGAAAYSEEAPTPPRRPPELGKTLDTSKPALSEARQPAADAQDDSRPAESRAARSAYRAILMREADRSGLPLDIADAVTAIESGYDPTVIGGVGEIGLMQIRPETAAMLGFKGDADELAKPDVNIHYGVTYLAQAWRLANGDLCRALMKYRAGHGEELMSPLSVNYCGRARAHLAALGSPFAAGASAPFVYDPALPKIPVVPRGPRIRTAAVSQAFWAAHDARVRALTRRVEAKWRRMAAR